MHKKNIESKLRKLTDVYEDIENKVTNLKKQTCISCIKGCGDCCKRFEPYISVLEAIPLADYLRKNPEKWAKYKHNVAQNEIEWTACPFYDEEDENHCTIYTIRPLICRLFGFSANRKSGEVKFATCNKIQQQMPEEVEKAHQYTKISLKVPVYQDIAEKIQRIDFEMATDYHPFSKSVAIALNNYEEIVAGNFSPQNKEKEHNFSELLRKKIKTGDVVS